MGHGKCVLVFINTVCIVAVLDSLIRPYRILNIAVCMSGRLFLLLAPQC